MPTLTVRGQTFLALGATVTAMGMVLGFPDITRVGVLLLGLPLLALAVTWRRSPALEVARHVDPPLVPAGAHAHVAVRVRNVGTRRSALYLAEDALDPALGPSPRFLLPRMDPRESHRVSYDVVGAVRGQHRVGPLTLHQHDPFGLARTSGTLASSAQIVVLPRITALGDAPVRGHGSGGDGPLPHTVALHGDDDVSVRSYREGDDLRHVHWPATAHRGELMVRQEERPARRRAVLVLDARARAHGGAGPEGTFERAVDALASVAVHLGAHGYALHLLTPQTVGAGQVETDVEGALRALALAEPTETALAEEALRATHSVAVDGALVVAVLADADAAPTHAGGPGTAALALVVEDADGPDAEPRPGWRTEVLRTGPDLRPAWERLTRTTAEVAR
ncbi:DUF58 domain-containing protein [Georgenia faecalis]|uniref:DUF58 domain-containing protein n=1 Tax=Georgenia faecalis TaxID=2483799 RepID=A0ABV9D688_9MICO|nr:DUF58 domain-containing protein [Georgenia faecalis]